MLWDENWNFVLIFDWKNWETANVKCPTHGLNIILFYALSIPSFTSVTITIVLLFLTYLRILYTFVHKNIIESRR